MREKVLLLFGGESVEHDISIITALQVMKSLPEEFEFLPVYIDRKGIWWVAKNLNDIKTFKNFEKNAIKKQQVSIEFGNKILMIRKGRKFFEYVKILSVLNCCHGHIGEDGCVQGLFDCCKIPQTSCGVCSSALCMDKSFMKDILKANNVDSPNYLYFQKSSYENVNTLQQIQQKIGFPLIVKPSNLGSSIGISICRNANDLDGAIELAFQFDKKVLIEKLVENLREFNCACFCFEDNVFMSKVNEVSLNGDMYTFEDKYLEKNQKIASGDKKLAKKIQKLTGKVYKLFDCKGVVRVDFLFDDKEKRLYVNEINTIPGSLAFYLFKDVAFKELVRCMIKQSFNDFEKRKELVTTFDSDALKIFEDIGFSSKK